MCALSSQLRGSRQHFLAGRDKPLLSRPRAFVQCRSFRSNEDQGVPTVGQPFSQSTHKNEATREVSAVLPADDEEQAASPFLDSILRSVTLGVGVGMLFELGHVVFQCVAAGKALPDLIPNGALDELLYPLRLWDNLAAMTGTFVFYVVEVAAILAVLKQYPNDVKSAYEALQSTSTLSKRLVPLSFKGARRMIYSIITGGSFQKSASTLSVLPDSQTHVLPTTSMKAADRVTALTSARGAAVLERPDAGSHAPTDSARRQPSIPSTVPQNLGRKIPSADKPQVSKESGLTGRRSGSKKLPGFPGIKIPNSPPPVKGKPATPGSGAGNAGRLDPATARFLAVPSTRAKMVRDRHAYLKNFWYAAALSSNLRPGKPLQVQILGRTVVMYRDQDTGKPICLDNVCPHRGAPLARGWLDELPPRSSHDCNVAASDAISYTHGYGGSTCIVCPYHGWTFDSSGVLREVPSQDDQRLLPKRPLLDAYPVEERGGFIWLFFGSSKLPSEERPPVPMCPELEDPNWTKVYGEIEFECPHWGVMDNLIDMAHVHYIHDDTFGNKDKPVIRDMEVAMGSFGITANFRIHNKPSNALWEWTATESVPVECTAHLPSTSVVKNYLGAGVSMVVFMNTVPISAQRSIVRFCHIRNFAGWEGLDMWARNAMIKILKEDKEMVEKLQPDTIRHEVSLQADMPQLAFRKVRQAWIDLGYGVDPESTVASGSLDM